MIPVSDSTPDQAAEIPQTPYAREIETHVGQDRIDRLTHIFKEIGVAEWLERHPLSRLELTQQVFTDAGNAANGIYSFILQKMQVATTRDVSEIRKVFEWQRVYSVSSTAQTPTEAIQRTLVHELGHHIHNMLQLRFLNVFKQTLAVNYLAGGTLYAQYNKQEYFAESFALYVFFQGELLQRDPEGHAMIELALNQLGLEVNPYET
jgi:hypothetical protein